MIDWKGIAQPALTRAGYPCGVPDGYDGERTYAALFAFDAQRPADDAIRALGRAAAAWLRGDAISQTPERLAEFVAQCGNETGGYRRFEEDLRYSAAAMRRQWPSHFTDAQAKAAVGKPIEIASRAYGGRMGNAPYPSRDGYTYRGRGMLQLTGRQNYRRFGKALGLSLEEQPDLAADPSDSLVIAREFWREGKVNAAIDDGDFAGARRITNAGDRFKRDKAGKLVVPIGVAEVARRRARLLAVLS